MLPGEQFKFWVNLMALANRSTTRGVVELSCQHIAWMLHLDVSVTAQYLTELKQAGLLDELPDSPGVTPHNWSARQYKSDDATGRSKEWRNNAGNVASNKEGENATLHATTHEQERNVSPSVSVNSPSGSESVHIEGSAEGEPVAPAKRSRTRKPPEDVDNVTQAFENFWEQYPRDRDGMKAGNKSKAREEFRKVNVADWDDLIVGLAMYKRQSKVQRGYVLNAERWLRERKWADALQAVPMPEVKDNAESKRDRAIRLGKEQAFGFALDEPYPNGFVGAHEDYSPDALRQLPSPGPNTRYR
jgi:hypothetical protein